MEYEIEDGDSVRLKSEKFRMNVKQIDNEMALCSFYDSIKKKDEEEWIKVQNLILVEKKEGVKFKIETGDVVHLKGEKFIMEVKERNNDEVLCIINKEDEPEWIKVSDLVLVRKSDGGFVK